MSQKLTAFFSSRYFQPLVWSLALVFLYGMDEGSGTSLCWFRFVGVEHCPGCGLGHSIHYALHLQWSNAWHTHPLGLPTTVALFYMIIKPFLTTKTFRYGL